MSNGWSQRALDALNLTVAGLQTGFGAFIPLYLAATGWSSGDIGLALTAGSVSAIVSQLPAGALVDWLKGKRLAAVIGLVMIGLAALAMALWPARPAVFAALVAHGFAGAMVNMAIASITLAVVGHAAFGERVGNNTRFAALGTAGSALLLGSTIHQLGPAGPLFVTAVLTLPTLAAMLAIPGRTLHENPHAEHHAAVRPRRVRRDQGLRALTVFRERGTVVFAALCALFQFASAAMLPFALIGLQRQGEAPGWVVSAAIVVPQLGAAAIAPWFGRLAERIGRRKVLLVGLAAIPARGALLAVLPGAVPLVAVEGLDGISAAVLGLMVPLIAADVTKQAGPLNVAIGTFGLAGGLGAAAGTAFAGVLDQYLGLRVTLFALSAAGGAACLVHWLAMPETKPAEDAPRPA
jgi:MFS family permease